LTTDNNYTNLQESLVARSAHPNKDIEKAIRHAEDNGWRVKESTGRGHAWGSLYCPYNDAECRCGEFCITSIWSTPKSPDNHSRQLRRVVDNCTTHKKQATAADADAAEKAAKPATE
jgi:hypothetical protein